MNTEFSTVIFLTSVLVVRKTRLAVRSSLPLLRRWKGVAQQTQHGLKLKSAFISRDTVGLSPRVQRQSISFGILEVGDETVFTDAGFGQECLSAVGADPRQCPLNIGRGKVD